MLGFEIIDKNDCECIEVYLECGDSKCYDMNEFNMSHLEKILSNELLKCQLIMNKRGWSKYCFEKQRGIPVSVDKNPSRE